METITTITSETKNACQYHTDAFAVKVRLNANRAVWRCAECLAQEAEARAELEAEMAYERHLEDRGWADAAFDREMEARMF